MTEPEHDRPEESTQADVTLVARGLTATAQVEVSNENTVVAERFFLAGAPPALPPPPEPGPEGLVSEADGPPPPPPPLTEPFAALPPPL